MTDRETRLRERIDELTDQRDAALADLHRVRCQRNKFRNRTYDLERSVDHWKTRALGERDQANGEKSGGPGRAASKSRTIHRNAKAGTGSNLDGPGPVPAEGAKHR